MKTHARVFAIAAAAAATALVMSGCSSSSSTNSSKEASTLTVLTNVQAGTPAAAVQQKVVAAFEKSTGKTVKLETAGVTIPKVYETSVAGGKEADVVMVNLADTTPNWVKEGIAVPASKYLKAWGLQDKILPEALKEWTNAQGKVQGFPYSGFVWPVWYNMELLGKAGIKSVPTSTTELLSDTKKLKAAGIPPFVVGGSDWSGEKLFIQIAQSYMTPAQATKVLSSGGYCSAPSLKGIKLFTQLRDAGMFVDGTQGYTSDQMNASFYGGKVAMMSAGSWAFGTTPTALQGKVQLSGFPLPAGGTYKKPTAYDGYTGLGFWISPNGDKADKINLTKKFITAWYDSKVAAEYAQASSGPVAVVSSGTKQSISNKVTSQAVNDLPGKVQFAVMPDTVVPANLQDAQIRQTAAAYAPGVTAATICASLDSIYPSK